MKSFEEWLQQPVGAKKELTWEDVENMYPDYVCTKRDGKAYVECCCCSSDIPISDYIEPEEFDPAVSETFYCGGSDRCCP